jgi:hypothetical protein
MATAARSYSDADWQAVLAHFPAETERLAHEHQVINVQWPNVKVHDAATLLRFLLLHVGADIPLRQTVTLIAEAGGPSLAPVWLHKRMRRAQPYLAALVELMIADVVEDAGSRRSSASPTRARRTVHAPSRSKSPLSWIRRPDLPQPRPPLDDHAG